jgi:hypothetical protein
VWSLAISPAFGSDSTLFAGTIGDGVFRSTDAGDSWERASPAVRVIPSATGSETETIRGLAISPTFSKDGTIFAATSVDGVLRSTDGGDSWYQVIKGLADPSVATLAISPTFDQDSTLFAGTRGGGVFRSTDGGDSWQQVNLGLTVTEVLALSLSPEFDTDRTIYAGTWGAGIFRGSDLELGTVTRTPTPSPLSRRTRAILGWSIIATLIAFVTSSLVLYSWWRNRPGARGIRRLGTWSPPPW